MRRRYRGAEQRLQEAARAGVLMPLIRPVFWSYGKTGRRRLCSDKNTDGVHTPWTTRPAPNWKPPSTGAWSSICAARTDVQNIDMMNLAGFCRNCLSNWMKDAADAKGVAMSKDESRADRLRHAL